MNIPIIYLHEANFPHYVRIKLMDQAQMSQSGFFLQRKYQTGQGKMCYTLGFC